MLSGDIHLEIGLLAFEGLDQADLTGAAMITAQREATARLVARRLGIVL